MRCYPAINLTFAVIFICKILMLLIFARISRQNNSLA